MKKKLIILSMAVFFPVFFYFFGHNQIYSSRGERKSNVLFEIAKGRGSFDIASELEEKGIVSGKYFFWLYLKASGLAGRIYPGQYLLSGNLTMPEVAEIITDPEKKYEKLLFKEGWTMKQMAAELSAQGFDGQAFLEIAQAPTAEILSGFPLLVTLPKGASLEGYLFPDTYYFAKEATPEGIVKKILNNTEARLADDLRTAIKDQEKSLFEIMTMASIVEAEVRVSRERPIVSGIFWKRLAEGIRLQSDATLDYILGTDAVKHSLEETRIDSPYNTYAKDGLPPGPIGNPGLSSIRAAIFPKQTEYFYFLNDAQTGETVFSKTFEEHVANKAKHGL